MVQGDGAVHAVPLERIAVQVDGVGPAEHHAVVVALVAVAVDEHDVAGLHQRLHHDLVGGAGAIGCEVGALSPESAGGKLLGPLQRTGGLQQRIESTGGGAGLSEEEVAAVEFAEILYPAALEHAVAPADGHGVEDTHGAAAVVLQCGEEGRIELLLDAAQQREVQLSEVLGSVEDAPESGEGVVLQAVHRGVGDEIAVDLRTEPAADAAQERAHASPTDRAGIEPVDGPGELAQDALVIGTGEGHTEADHHRLDVMVEQQGDERVLNRAHHHRIVHEGITSVAHLLQALPQHRFLRVVEVVDEQHLEVIGARLLPLRIKQLAPARERVQHGRRIAAESAAAEHAHDVVHGQVKAMVLPAPKHSLQLAHGIAARKGPVELDGVQVPQGRLHFLSSAAAFIEVHDGELQLVPGMRPEARGVVVLAELEGGFGHGDRKG